jgi:Cysteine-rich secretory protein family
MQHAKLRNAAILAAAVAVVSFSLIAFPKNPEDGRGHAAGTDASSSGPSGPARVLFEAANRERAAAGTPPLTWDAALARAAQRHAELLANGGAFEHQLPGEPNLAERASAAGAHFSYISENIAQAPDPESMHVGWMHSPGHRSNLLSPKVNAVGIAVVARGSQLYGVEDFARTNAELSLAGQEKKVSRLLASRGWRISDAYVTEARQACAGTRPSGLRMNLAILQFETSDLSQLPPSVERDLRSRHLGTASVGACKVGATGGFTQYRLAVLLY